MTAPVNLERMSGAGNSFVVLDVFGVDDAVEASELPDVARKACRGSHADGLLVLASPTTDTGADARMIVFNADGSRPEACGNGLRCVAALAVARGRVPVVVGDELRIETDAGVRPVQVIRAPGAADSSREIVAATADMGRPDVGRAETLSVLKGEVEGVRVVLGNPHLVVFVDDVERTPVSELGPALSTHASFPGGTNVEFCAVEGEALRLRVWERGVGETPSCGTGACAAAVAAVRTGRAASPVVVRAPGGELTVAWPGAGPVRLTGPVVFEGPA